MDDQYQKRRRELSEITSKNSDLARNASIATSPPNDPFSNELVFREILSLLKTEDLLECSLVSKRWCITSREILRSQKKCLAAMEGVRPCEELLRLNETLAQSFSHPFSGLVLRTSEKSKDNPRHICIEGTVSESYSAILKEMSFNIFEIYWPYQKPSCPAQSLISKILKDEANKISELRLTKLPTWDNTAKKILGMVSEDSLANVNTLYLNSGLPSKVKYELIRKSPQLQKVFGLVRLSELGFFMRKNRVPLMQELVFLRGNAFQGTEDLVVKMIEFIAFRPKLRRIVVPFICYDWLTTRGDSGLKVGQDALMLLFGSVSSSLEQIELHHHNLILLSRAPPTSLPAVKEINLNFNEGIDRLMGYSTLENFDWTGWFPNLETLIIGPDLASWISLSAAEKLLIGEDAVDPYSCPTVRQVILKQHHDKEALNFESLRCLGRLFPNVKEISLGEVSNLREGLDFATATWQQVESIAICSIATTEASSNLDSLFYGMDENGALLAYQGDPAEESVLLKHALLAPSILMLKHLKHLRITIRHTKPCPAAAERNGSTPLTPAIAPCSHVTTALALGPMSGLKVKLLRDICSQEAHLCRFNHPHLTQNQLFRETLGEEM